MQRGGSGPNKVIRYMNASRKRQISEEKRAAFDEEKRKEREARKKAKNKLKMDESLKHKKRLHKNGTSRARLIVEDGQQEIEVDSDAELSIVNDVLSDTEDKDIREDPPERKKCGIVYKSDDSTTSRCKALYSILDTLNRMKGHPNVSECVISEHTGIQLRDKRNADLLKDILKNPGLVHHTEEDGTLFIKKVAPMHVEDKADLHYLFENRIPFGEIATKHGHSVLGVTENDIKDAYRGIERDIDGMVAKGANCSLEPC